MQKNNEKVIFTSSEIEELKKAIKDGGEKILVSNDSSFLANYIVGDINKDFDCLGCFSATLTEKLSEIFNDFDHQSIHTVSLKDFVEKYC